jgi:hypothetical protein
MIVAEGFLPIFAKRRLVNIVFNVVGEVVCALPIVLA